MEPLIKLYLHSTNEGSMFNVSLSNKLHFSKLTLSRLPFYFYRKIFSIKISLTTSSSTFDCSNINWLIDYLVDWLVDCRVIEQSECCREEEAGNGEKQGTQAVKYRVDVNIHYGSPLGILAQTNRRRCRDLVRLLTVNGLKLSLVLVLFRVRVV